MSLAWHVVDSSARTEGLTVVVVGVVVAVVVVVAVAATVVVVRGGVVLVDGKGYKSLYHEGMLSVRTGI